jgi:hypothetical protein
MSCTKSQAILLAKAKYHSNKLLIWHHAVYPVQKLSNGTIDSFHWRQSIVSRLLRLPSPGVFGICGFELNLWRTLTEKSTADKNCMLNN